ncbi:hypothetical protein MESS4_530102 [Mesorhizobium sp. STM 4661]|nr:hypothetical protein MESS4_530102 [Mesorhizobium sp. STM 4661]
MKADGFEHDAPVVRPPELLIGPPQCHALRPLGERRFAPKIYSVKWNSKIMTNDRGARCRRFEPVIDHHPDTDQSLAAFRMKRGLWGGLFRGDFANTAEISTDIVGVQQFGRFRIAFGDEHGDDFGRAVMGPALGQEICPQVDVIGPECFSHSSPPSVDWCVTNNFWEGIMFHATYERSCLVERGPPGRAIAQRYCATFLPTVRKRRGSIASPLWRTS